MKSESLYQQLLGASFGALPAPLRRFHSLQGEHVLEGWAEIDAPANWAGKCMAWCLGAPLAAQRGAIRFELQANPQAEVWVRHFPSKTMRSRLTASGTHVVERLGPARLLFALESRPERLEMKLQRLEFLGIPCPRWLAPAIVAEETADAGRLNFRVQATVPVIGLVTSYRGHIVMPMEDAA
jgi:hypothetical protein